MLEREVATVYSPDPALVSELAELAATLDGGHAEADAELVDRFNALAGSQLTFRDFQGIYGAQEHDEFVEELLVSLHTPAAPSLDRAELVRLVQSVLDDPVNDKLIRHAEATIDKTLGVSGFTDAIFWPDLFFGPDRAGGEPTAEQIADELLRRSKESKTKILL